MAHQQYRSFILLEGVLERFHRFDVKVICRLVEQKKIRAAKDHHCERDPGALPTGQRVGTTLSLVAGKSKSGEMTLNLAAFPLRPEIAYDIIERSIHGHLRHVLAIVARLHGSAHPQLSARDAALTTQRSKEGRFPTAVWTDETDDIATLDGCGEPRDQGSSFDIQRYVPCYRDLIATSL